MLSSVVTIFESKVFFSLGLLAFRTKVFQNLFIVSVRSRDSCFISWEGFLDNQQIHNRLSIGRKSDLKLPLTDLIRNSRPNSNTCIFRFSDEFRLVNQAEWGPIVTNPLPTFIADAQASGLTCEPATVLQIKGYFSGSLTNLELLRESHLGWFPTTEQSHDVLNFEILVGKFQFEVPPLHPVLPRVVKTVRRLLSDL